MVSYSTQNPLNQEASVNHATFHVCGFKRATVRMTVGNFDMGFATLAYSGKKIQTPLKNTLLSVFALHFITSKVGLIHESKQS